MAKIIYEYYDKKDLYNDGQIENKLLNYYKNDKKINFNNDEVFYLTNSIRQNIISWYPFESDSVVMEIGAGVGTITKALCEKCKKVISVEASKRRAEILYERHKKYDNLSVLVSNINDLPKQYKADYIVLVGVFEYSRIFFDSVNPFDTFIQLLKKHLNKNGKILIAIENRFGIKYFAGNNEDHLALQYKSLFGYDNEKVCTFGKKELIDIFERNGIKNYKFYSVFPDYKMPQLLISDDFKLSKYQIESIPIYNQNINEVYTFDPRKVLYGLQENNQLSFFANSYLCEISPYSVELCDYQYIKFQAIRNDDYNVYTVISNKSIKKFANSPGAINHINNIYNIHKLLNQNNIKTCKITKISDLELDIERIDGHSFEDVLLEYYYLGDVKNFITFFDLYYKYLKSICEVKKNVAVDEELSKCYGSEDIFVLKHGLLDLNLGNVFISKDNDIILIDQEFDTNNIIPLDYVVYFSIKLFFEKIGITNDLLEEKLYNKYKINSVKRDVFNSISRNYFVKNNKINNDLNFNKIMEHGRVIINAELNNLNNDICFYKDLLEKTKSGYEEEIRRLNDENRLLAINANVFENAKIGYEQEINRLESTIMDLNKQLNSKKKYINKIKKCVHSISNIKEIIRKK